MVCRGTAYLMNKVNREERKAFTVDKKTVKAFFYFIGKFSYWTQGKSVVNEKKV